MLTPAKSRMAVNMFITATLYADEISDEEEFMLLMEEFEEKDANFP